MFCPQENLCSALLRPGTHLQSSPFPDPELCSPEVQPFPCAHFSVPSVCVTVGSTLSLLGGGRAGGGSGSHTQSPGLVCFTRRLQARADSALSPGAACTTDGSAQVLPAALGGSMPFLSPGERLVWSQGSSAEQLRWPGLGGLGVISG